MNTKPFKDMKKQSTRNRWGKQNIKIYLISLIKKRQLKMTYCFHLLYELKFNV